MPRPSHLPWLYYLNSIWWCVLVMKLLIMQCFPVSYHFLLLRPNVLSTLFSNTFNLRFSLTELLIVSTYKYNKSWIFMELCIVKDCWVYAFEKQPYCLAATGRETCVPLASRSLRSTWLEQLQPAATRPRAPKCLATAIRTRPQTTSRVSLKRNSCIYGFLDATLLKLKISVEVKLFLCPNIPAWRRILSIEI